MAIANALKKLFKNTVTIESYSATSGSGYNKPGYSAAVIYTAKIEDTVTIVRDENNDEKKSTRKIFLFTQTVPTTKDRITLPAGYAPLTPKIIAVQTLTDLTGTSHVVVYTGQVQEN